MNITAPEVPVSKPMKGIAVGVGVSVVCWSVLVLAFIV